MSVRHIHTIAKIPELENRQDLQKVEEVYKLKTTTYYNDLIDWNDPDDPIRNIVIPQMAELDEWGSLDASGEHHYQKMEGMEHKYQDTVLLLATNHCEAYCRYCFRKRLFLEDNDETIKKVDRAIEYIREHQEVNNVLLTGGDPMSLSPKRIMDILKQLESIPHLNFIRIGTKILSFNPYRIIENPELLEFFASYKKPIYIMSHFAHRRELTTISAKAIEMLLDTNNVIISNQTPLLKGVNSDQESLQYLLETLVQHRVVPYYFFQMRPVSGNKNYVVPIEENILTIQETLRKLPGLMGRVKLVMSHVTGKVELVGLDEQKVYMRYHRAQKIEDYGKMLVFDRDPKACWLDDYLKM